MFRFKMRHLVLLTFPLLVAGCASVEDQRIGDQSKCLEYGFQLGTDGFANCMMERDVERKSEDRQARERIQAQVDRDKARKARRKSEYIDDRPSFDRDGNPNFNTDGNYQGCHGVGCIVDNPDL